MRKIFLGVGILWQAALVFAAEPVQSAASFTAAIRNTSTSPSYVAITVDDGTERHEVCTKAPFLLGALMREYGLDGTPAGRARATGIALASPAHTYRLTHPDALANIAVHYNDSDLAAARAAVALYADADLPRTFSTRRDTGKLDRDALACALLERGLSSQQADRSGQVYLSPGL